MGWISKGRKFHADGATQAKSRSSTGLRGSDGWKLGTKICQVEASEGGLKYSQGQSQSGLSPPISLI